MRGRQPKNVTRTAMLKVRLTVEEMRLLGHIAEETGQTKSDVIRKALQSYCEEVIQNEKYVTKNHQLY